MNNLLNYIRSCIGIRSLSLVMLGVLSGGVEREVRAAVYQEPDVLYLQEEGPRTFRLLPLTEAPVLASDLRKLKERDRRPVGIKENSIIYVDKTSRFYCGTSEEKNKRYQVPSPDIADLPPELICLALSFLDSGSLVKASEVSTHWKSCARDSSVWRDRVATININFFLTNLRPFPLKQYTWFDTVKLSIICNECGSDYVSGCDTMPSFYHLSDIFKNVLESTNIKAFTIETPINSDGAHRETEKDEEALVTLIRSDHLKTFVLKPHNVNWFDLGSILKAIGESTLPEIILIGHHFLGESIEDGDPDKEALSRMLRTNQHLTTVDLSDNFLRYAGLMSLLEVAESHRSLKRLDLRKNLEPISQEAIEKIEELKKTIKALEAKKPGLKIMI